LDAFVALFCCRTLPAKEEVFGDDFSFVAMMKTPSNLLRKPAKLEPCRDTTSPLSLEEGRAFYVIDNREIYCI
jgi:hypothetical protein